MDLTLRPIGPDELDAFRAVTGIALGWEPRPEDSAKLQSYFEYDRAVAAADGTRIVGTLGAFSLALTVPGAVVPTAGTTFVGVLPTHRRRGVLRAMMARHFADVRARGEALAALWASEGTIYGRFGYGIAAYQNRQVLPRGAAFRGAPPEGEVRLVDAAEAQHLFPPLYARACGTVPGMFARGDAWWRQRRFYDPPHRRGDASALMLAVHEDRDGVQGYMKYRRTGRPFVRDPQRIVIGALVAASAAAHAALWRFASSIDLIGEVEGWNRPADDPLVWLLEDPRALQQTVRDALWVRVMDVRAALAARRYAAPGRLVLAVEDELCPWNAGTFALDGGPEGATCTQARASPDLVVPIDALGAIYLGGNPLSQLARAGRASGSPAALARADAMFASPRAPWCPEIF
jgi:predicted acetyltransferase